MTTERMAYFARKYLEERISFWVSTVYNMDVHDIEAKNALEDYRQELQDLNDTYNLGNLTEEGHW